MKASRRSNSAVDVAWADSVADGAEEDSDVDGAAAVGVEDLDADGVEVDSVAAGVDVAGEEDLVGAVSNRVSDQRFTPHATWLPSCSPTSSRSLRWEPSRYEATLALRCAPLHFFLFFSLAPSALALSPPDPPKARLPTDVLILLPLPQLSAWHAAPLLLARLAVAHETWFSPLPSAATIRSLHLC
jgi:hypothetical protein